MTLRAPFRALLTAGVATALGTLSGVALAQPATAPTPSKAEPPHDARAGAGDPGKPYTEQIAGTTVSIDMVPIPGGAAPDGTVLSPFSISVAEIPWDVYDVWVFSLDVPEGAADASTRPTKPYLLMDRGYGHQGYPAISMSHKGAQEFCAWLSRKTGKKYRLPTDAEWEYACRAGSKGTYFFEGDLSSLGDYAWFAANSDQKTHPIGQKKPNAWGLRDMLGNASEWVTDRDGNPTTVGGCFRDEATDLTVSARVEPSRAWNASDPQIPKSVWWLADGGFVGFRVVCEGDGTK